MYSYKESFICTYNDEETAVEVMNLIRLNIPCRFVKIKQYARNHTVLRIDFTVKAASFKLVTDIAAKWRLLLINAMVHPNIKLLEVNGFPEISGR